jgi:hypothetical protein
VACACEGVAQPISEPSQARVMVVSHGKVCIGQQPLVDVTHDDGVDGLEWFAPRTRQCSRVPPGAFASDDAYPLTGERCDIE